MCDQARTEIRNTRFDFKFEMDQKVITPFGDEGVITMLGYDDGGRTYFIQTATNSAWFKEKMLTV